MESWIYLFSRFTNEALLFEALFVLLLLACYSAYWVLRKRRMGAAETLIPAGVVKSYLNELIGDAQAVRAQLFGLLGAVGGDLPTRSAGPSLANLGNLDPALIQKLTLLEAKLAEQATALQNIAGEKEKLEKALADARAGAVGAAAAGSGDSAATNDLKAKIQNLEGKLAEYSVIEDDLANLKRLQQENAQLRTALAGKGGESAHPSAAAAPAAAASPPAPAPAPVAAPAAAAAVAAAATVAATTPAAAEPAPSPLDAMTAATPAEAAGGTPEPSFDGLVGQVEQSLQAEPAEEAAPPAGAAAPMADDKGEKSDADLVAEFEKMLNS